MFGAAIAAESNRREEKEREKRGSDADSDREASGQSSNHKHDFPKVRLHYLLGNRDEWFMHYWHVL